MFLFLTLNMQLPAGKHTQVSVNGQQALIECSNLWREIKKVKDNVATKFEAQELMLQWILNANRPRKVQP